MGSLNFKNLQNVKSEADYTYVDLHLDLKEDTVLSRSANKNVKQRDIKVDYDDAAIKNSIINILNTTPGERFLIPMFGANLRGYLFKPVTKETGEMIGNTILRAIEDWEPRVTVENITVVSYIAGTIVAKNTGSFSNIRTEGSVVSEDEYDVTIIISIPQLKKRSSLTGVFSRNGFMEAKTVS